MLVLSPLAAHYASRKRRPTLYFDLKGDIPVTMTSPSPIRQISFATAIEVVAILSIAYALSQFLRASPGVIAPELARALNLGPEALGSLSGAFFFIFALAQVPVGIALDRWGPRRVMLTLSVFTMAGCVVFAWADGIAMLIAGRMLMGFGCAAMLMGPYVIYARDFPADRFAQVCSIQLGIGYLGALVATTPLALAADAWGWRTVFLVAAGAAVAFAALTGLVVRKGMGEDDDPRQMDFGVDLIGVFTVVRLKALQAVMPLNFVAYGSVASILTLWGGPYLADVHGLGPADRGNILLVMMAMAIAGLIGFGTIERRVRSKRRMIIAGVGLNAAALAALALWPAAPLGISTVLLCTTACANGVNVAITGYIRRALPPALMGRGLTFMNMGAMLGVAVLQILLGWVAAASGAPDSGLTPQIYARLFGTLVIILTTALVWFAWRSRALKGTQQTLSA